MQRLGDDLKEVVGSWPSTTTAPVVSPSLLSKRPFSVRGWRRLHGTDGWEPRIAALRVDCLIAKPLPGRASPSKCFGVRARHHSVSPYDLNWLSAINRHVYGRFPKFAGRSEGNNRLKLQVKTLVCRL
jgi:hypothetical protein